MAGCTLVNDWATGKVFLKCESGPSLDEQIEAKRQESSEAKRWADECQEKFYKFRDAVERTQKELAELKAAKAKQDAEKAKTVGERLADSHLDVDGDDVTFIRADGMRHSRLVAPNSFSAPFAKVVVASLIDKAVADAKAEQREADARIVDEAIRTFDECADIWKGSRDDSYGQGKHNAFVEASRVLRRHK